jgi:hypothetical protein
VDAAALEAKTSESRQAAATWRRVTAVHIDPLRRRL